MADQHAESPDRHDADAPRRRELRRRRDQGLRRARAIVAGVAVGAVGASGMVAVVAAQAFKGRPRSVATATAAQPLNAARVPGPQAVPSIAGDPAPLRPPAQPPAAPSPTPAPSAPAPQVSGGS